MRWLLDQGLPRSTTALLQDAGHDALHVGDLGMAASSDADILAYATETNRIIVTLDADFHALVARTGPRHPSTLRIREEGLKARQLSRLLVSIAIRFEKELLAGCLMSFHDRKVRFRRLPIN